jgi:Domain of Unknown Function with PDB structure (DUF3857)/Transglutaminase-like superfamily
MYTRLIGLLFAAGITFAAPVFAFGDEAPSWLRQAAELKVPAFDKRVSAVVLVDDSTMTVGEDGRVTRVSTYAVRILTREGREAAVAAEAYETDSSKVREIHAWLIRPSGQVKRYGKDNTIDEAEAVNDVYDESRIKKISAVSDAEAGSVFGYQTTAEIHPFFNQTKWYFQETSPVMSSRITLALPAGWRARGVTFNHASVEPTVSGSNYTWELRDLPPLEIEPASPNLVNLVPRLAINYWPAEGVRAPSTRSFDNWNEVSRWYTSLTEPQSGADEKIAAKARELTAGAKTELERIRAIAAFVQHIQYISIQIGVGRWRPHAAPQVFSKSYGDCKDKANLVRAMLGSINIQAFPVLIFLGDPTYVREDWPSVLQFNHCIVAIRVSDETVAATVIKHPALGRLLIFDATDEHTPIGDLPDEEQGSLALIAAGDAGGLLRMPSMPPESSWLERNADVVLTADGAITASVKERSTGQAAVNERRAFRSLSSADYKQMIERWVTRGATAAKVTKVQPADNRSEGKFDLDVDFSALAYAQSMQDRLLVFKPAIISRRESLFLTERKRSHPVVLHSRAFNETVRVKLPLGFDIDELPDPVKLDAPFGSYKTSYEVKNGELFFTRALSQQAATIPAEQYETVRKFFERIRAAEQAPVVLAKK